MADNPKYKLWKSLNDSKYYTKSYEEFEQQFSSEASVGKLYNALNSSKYYTKSEQEFKEQFFFSKAEPSSKGSEIPSLPSAKSGIAPFKGGYKVDKQVSTTSTRPSSASTATFSSQEKTAPIEDSVTDDLRKVDTELPTEAPLVQPPISYLEPQFSEGKKYRLTAPNANKNLNLVQLEKAEKSLKPQEFGTNLEYENVRAQLEDSYKTLEMDYLEFLKAVKPDEYSYKASKLQEIQQKGKPTPQDQQFLLDFRNDALTQRILADQDAIKDITSEVDFKTYEIKGKALSDEAEKLQKEAKSLIDSDGRPINANAKKRLELIANRLDGINTDLDSLSQETGVNEEVLNKLSTLYDSQTENKLFKDLQSVRFPELNVREGMSELDKKTKEELLNSSNPAKKGVALLMTFTDAIGSGVVKTTELPKVVSDALGYGGEYGFTDALYDTSVELNKRAEGRMQAEAEGTITNLVDMFMQGAGNVTLFATGGSLATGSVKTAAKLGEKALKFRQNAGVVTTAFLMSEGDYYREALDNGLNSRDAALYSTMIGLATAVSETVVPDNKYFDAANRKNLVNAIKQGKDVKSAFAEYFAKIGLTGVKEAGEEVLTEGVETGTKELINVLSAEQIYKDTFDIKDYKEAALAGFVTGGGMTALRRSKKSPIEKEAQRQIAENAEEITSSISETNPEAIADIAADIELLTKVNRGLENLPAYTELGNAEKDEVLDLLVEKARLKKSASEAGVKDDTLTEKIDEIDAKVNGLFSGFKIGEQVEIETEEGMPNKIVTIGDVVGETPVGEVVKTVTTQGQEKKESPVFLEKNVTNEVVETTPVEVQDALKDVENTAKALEGKDIKDAMPFFSIKGLKKFFHASNQKRVGRLKKSTAQQFGTGVYFSTNKDLVKNEFGENVSEVVLDLKNPVFTNTSNWKQVVDLALKKANEGKPIDEDGVIEGEVTDYYEIDSKFISDAATELGYDAIIDENSPQYENEIIVLDDARIVYEEDLPNFVAEAYHAAKADDSNPELVQAVESLLGQPNTLQEGVKIQGVPLQENLSKNTQSVEQYLTEPSKVEVTQEFTEPESQPTTLKFFRTPEKQEEFKSKRQKIKEENRRLSGFTPTTIEGWVRQYFVFGGRVDSDSLRKELGLNDSRVGDLKSRQEFNSRIGFLKKNGTSISRLAEDIAESIFSETGQEVNDNDIRGIIIDLLRTEDKTTMRLQLEAEFGDSSDNKGVTNVERFIEQKDFENFEAELDKARREQEELAMGIANEQYEKDYEPYEYNVDDVAFVDTILNSTYDELVKEYFDVISENGELDEQLYKAQLDEQRTEIEGADNIGLPPTPPPTTTTPNLEGAEGEERNARRGQRIVQNKAYQDKLTSFSKTYTSVDTKALALLVSDYMPEYYQSIKDLGKKDANEQLINFLTSLYVADINSIANNENIAFTRTAFATMVAQKVAQDAFAKSDIETLTLINDFLDKTIRRSGTDVAMQSLRDNIDPLMSMITELTRKTTEVLKGTARSGRTKQEVVNDIVDEMNAAKKDAVDNLDTDSLENLVEVKETPKPPKKVSTSKRAKLMKEKEEAIAALKRLRSGNVGFAASPQQSAESSKEFAKNILKLARVQIQLGAYTIGEVVAKVYKDVGMALGISKDSIRDIVESSWVGNLEDLANNTKQEEAVELLADALEGRDSNKSFKALAKAIKIINPNFIKAKKSGRRISDRQAIEEILNNKEEAEGLLSSALEYIRQEIIVEGKFVDSINVPKPANMTDEQWNAVKAKYVFNQIKFFVDNLLGKVSEKGSELQSIEDSKKRAKEISKAVKAVAKKFYKEGGNTQSFAEALLEELPFLSLSEALKLSTAVEQQIDKLIQARDNRRIKNLVKEITEDKEEANIMKVIAKTMWNRGALNSFQFAQLFSGFLGFKGVPLGVVNNMMALIQQANTLPSSLARTIVMRNVNNLAMMYSESTPSFFSSVIAEVLFRNILGTIKSIFTAGLSVFFGSIPHLIGYGIVRPQRSFRAAKFVAENFVSGRYAVLNALRETMINHRTPIAREIPKEENAYVVDRAWIRARNTKLKEIRDLAKRDKGKAIAYTTAKILIGASGQAKYFGIVNTVNDFMSFLDYINVAALRDFHLALEAQKQIDVKAVTSVSKEIKNLLATDPTTIDRVEKEVDTEIQDMISRGTAVPRGYRDLRMQQKVTENQPSAMLSKAHEEALQAVLMGEPTTLVGSAVYRVFRGIKEIGQPEVANQMNLIGAAINWLTLPLTLFSRIAIVMAERGVTNIPYLGLMLQAVPFEFRQVGKSIGLRRNEDGSVYVKYKDDPKMYAARVAYAGLITSFVSYLITTLWDDEEIVKEDGTPLINPKTNKPYTRKVFKGSKYIDFFGNDPSITANEKGTSPRNVIRFASGTDDYGNLTYTDYPVQALPPHLIPTALMLGQLRDNERYLDEKVTTGLIDGQVIDQYKANDIEWTDVVSVTLEKSIQSDFSYVGRLLKGITAQKGMQTFVEATFVDPTKRLVSPRQFEEITHQLQQINGQRKVYIEMNGDDISEYLMKDIWFTDPFIPDRENFESVDPFGFKIDFPPMYASFIGMFGTSTTYALAAHEQKHQDYYNLFKDENGVYNPKQAPMPKRFVYNSVTVLDDNDTNIKRDDVRAQKTVLPELRRKIGDDAYVNFGAQINDYGLDNLKAMPYEERVNVLGYLWDVAKYQAVKTYFPESTIREPKLRDKFESTEEQIRNNVKIFNNFNEINLENE